MGKLIIGLLVAILVIVLVIIGGSAVFALTYKPASRPADPDPIERTPARLSRGEYLVNHVTPCAFCHTEGYGTGSPGAYLAGGACVDNSDGFPGTLCPANLTPDSATGLGSWTDGEISRAIREGVNNQGKALFPMMPYAQFRVMSDSDVAAIVAWLRTIPAVHRPRQPTDIDFPVSFFIKMAPKPLNGPVPAIDPTDEVVYGRYLTTIAGCKFCHTPVDERVELQQDSLFAGGHAIRSPGGLMLRSRNLTPDATGLGATTEEGFLTLFRVWRGRDSSAAPLKDSPMPWAAFSGMTDADLSAIYAYLRTVPPVRHVVDATPVRAATP